MEDKDENNSNISAEIERLFKEDQLARCDFTFFMKDKELIRNADKIRRSQIEVLLKSPNRLAKDYYYAAMIFQHGETTEDFLKAHHLAQKAHELGEPLAKWLIAASYDRWLKSQGKAQKWGTQLELDSQTNKWVIGEVDCETTDKQRAEMDVLPIDEYLTIANQKLSLNK